MENTKNIVSHAFSESKSQKIKKGVKVLIFSFIFPYFRIGFLIYIIKIRKKKRAYPFLDRREKRGRFGDTAAGVTVDSRYRRRSSRRSLQTKGERRAFERIGKLSQPKYDSWSDCAKDGYAVKPRKGDALLFFSLHLDATTDSDSLHGSCPVIKGEKWSATKWIHVRSFDTAKWQSVNRDCVDENENCATWASAGECEKNPSYMIGSEDYYGYCRKSCKVCSS